jgi:O-succinylbenzoate synthase
MMFLEHRGIAKTATEVRGMMSGMDKDHSTRLSFIEWCCAFYSKSFEELDNFSDEAARAIAIEEAMKAGEVAKAAEEEIERAKIEKELQAAARAEELEKESKLVSLSHHLQQLQELV